MTVAEFMFVAKRAKRSYDEVARAFAACGTRWITGGGAEILDDAFRLRHSPGKYKVEDYYAAQKAILDAGMGSTATMVIGFDETLAERMKPRTPPALPGRRGWTVVQFPLLDVQALPYRPRRAGGPPSTSTSAGSRCAASSSTTSSTFARACSPGTRTHCRACRGVRTTSICRPRMRSPRRPVRPFPMSSTPCSPARATLGLLRTAARALPGRSRPRRHPRGLRDIDRLGLGYHGHGRSRCATGSHGSSWHRPARRSPGRWTPAPRLEHLDSWDPDATIRENCFPGLGDDALRFPVYDDLGVVAGRHCSGTDHQDIQDIEKVVFLGDSITAGTPRPCRRTSTVRS